MHIVVCVKQVPDTMEVRIDPKTNTLVRAGVPSIINPYDIHAVEEAMRLKEKFGASVTAITMGPPQAEEVLRKAISFGVDKAILLSDRAFAGSDTLATSYVLAQAIRKLSEEQPVDLVLCGKQAIDGDTAQVGPGIATRLNIPQLTYVMKIDYLDLEKREIQVQRKLEGEREIVKATLPALLTVTKDINELRYASFPNLLRAARYRPLLWNKESLLLEEGRLGIKGSPTAVRRIFAPPEREGGEIIPGGMDNPEKAAAELVDKLITTKIIADR
ncbi:electron transfer flavoprotein subunit beta/FixA family protein [Calderihabitans maritimus]|uniref:Electron transfer flavoprotein small subunit n=1 Tax=Calderihabitans maritimus TaxID=1246530 RepID=A0A1Z5HQT7_9FIRM|nr:electron transfer flavoprotein subunit beta/FixA family protein [Calderihabitans maritimus]GAW91640.1 electron transfer flavoprotein, beta subunit [Calderihabitans maritimus]